MEEEDLWNALVGAIEHLGNNPLHEACQEGDLVAGIPGGKGGIADMMAGNKLGQTPPHSACSRGHVNEVDYLLRSSLDSDRLGDGIDVDINLRAADDTTTLHIACEEGHADVVQDLLQAHHIDVNAQATFLGSTPLHVAAKKGHVRVVWALLQFEHTNAISPGAVGTTPFHSACYKGRRSVVECFLRHMDDKGIDMNVENAFGQPGFHIACSMNHIEVVESMLEFLHGDSSKNVTFDPNLQDMHGSTSLHMLCEKGATEMIQHLLRSQHTRAVINLNTRNEDAQTPLRSSDT
eukprot:CAMPEP_0198134316 /NCGR_PEP_ID=MMETSP1442-20131203/60017_1 /TAXON_ID= /ORGANISM="Craspedostauros australis, Strain CCMP3328" /LENGTH=291 /DNA_ID=CAMNT_0043795459 /DNA_START=538 /DNA_END=1414 /DNA_ORIENTATION=+